MTRQTGSRWPTLSVSPGSLRMCVSQSLTRCMPSCTRNQRGSCNCFHPDFEHSLPGPDGIELDWRLQGLDSIAVILDSRRIQFHRCQHSQRRQRQESTRGNALQRSWNGCVHMIAETCAFILLDPDIGVPVIHALQARIGDTYSTHNGCIFHHSTHSQLTQAGLISSNSCFYTFCFKADSWFLTLPQPAFCPNHNLNSNQWIQTAAHSGPGMFCPSIDCRI